MARCAAVWHGPSSSCGFEGVAKIFWGDRAVVFDQMRREAEDHGGFPFAGMAHDLLAQTRMRMERFRLQVPVCGKQQKGLFLVPVFLADFKDGLFTRNIVAAMPVENQETFEAVREEVFEQSAKQIQVYAGFCGKCAGKIQVVVGISKPLQGGEQRPVSKRQLGAAGDLTHQKRVGEDGQVGAVLFEGGNWENDGGVPVQGVDRRPGEIG